MVHVDLVLAEILIDVILRILMVEVLLGLPVDLHVLVDRLLYEGVHVLFN